MTDAQSLPAADPVAAMIANYADVHERLMRGAPRPLVVHPQKLPVLITVKDDDEYMSPKARKTVSVIAREVTQKHNVKWLDIISHRRTNNLCVPRFEIMWRARHETLLSLPVIGRIMHRDHSTVHYAIGRYQAMLDAGEVAP